MPSASAPEYRTLNDIFYKAIEYDSPDIIRALRKDKGWENISCGELYARVRALAGALTNLGLRKGDRAAIISENRWEWAVSDFATLLTGIVNVPLFPTLHAPQIGELLLHSGARVAIVSTAAQLKKVLEVRGQTALEHIVVMDDVPAKSSEDANVLSFTSLIEHREVGRDTAFDTQAASITGGDLASIIYTSGTTGEPKGVMLTHGNMASNVSYSLREFSFTGPQRTVSFLPLSHVTARHVDYDLYSLGFSVAYCPTMDKLMGSFKSVRPTFLITVPRVLEKIRHEVERRSRASKVKTAVVRWAMGIGKAHEAQTLGGQTPSSVTWKLADKLFYSKVRDVFGGAVTHLLAGGAPLGPDTTHWFAQAGIRILEGYGLTETSPVIGVNTPVPGGYRVGSIGKPLLNLQVKTASDGELLVKGPSVFSGYWQSPELTREAFDAEGWFQTGDIVSQDADGFIFITDRKKELIKTSAGKFVAPQPIESRLKADSFVSQAALVGDRERYVAALISPNFEVLESWAREQKIAAETRRQLVEHPLVVARFRETVKQVNSTLADYELLKRFILVPDEWAIDSGEMTPSLKLKRRVLQERYREEIAGLFR